MQLKLSRALVGVAFGWGALAPRPGSAQAPPPAAEVAVKPGAEPAGWAGIRLSPEVGFGWLDEERGAPRPESVFRAGLGFAWQHEALEVRVAARYQRQQRSYLGEGLDLETGALGQVVVGEHAVEGEAGVWYDLAPALGVRGRALSLTVGGGLLARQLINDTFPATIGGVLAGAGLGLALSQDLRLQVDVDYTYNLARFALEGTDSAFGSHLGYLRYGAGLRQRLDDQVALGLSYRGSWLALERAALFDHAVVLHLTFAWAR